MKIKHKVIQDYQLTTTDKKIFVLKAGVILENYVYKLKNNEVIEVDRDIIDNNSSYFLNVDWKAELIIFLKQSKIAQPSIIGKKLIPFIEETFVIQSNSGDIDNIEIENKLRDINKLEIKLRESEKEIENKLRDINKLEIKLRESEKEIEGNLNVNYFENNYKSSINEIYNAVSSFGDSIHWPQLLPDYKEKFDGVINLIKSKL